MTLIRTSVIYSATQILLLVVGIVSSVVISRAFGPNGRGILALVALVVTTATVLATFGFGSAYAFLAGKRSYAYDELVGSAVVTSLVLGIAVALILLLVWDGLLSGLLRGLSWPQFVIATASIPFAFATFFVVNLLVGAGQAARAAIMQLCTGVFGAVVSVAAVGLAHQSVSVMVLVGSVGTAVIALWCVAIVGRDYGIRFSKGVPIGVAVAKYGANVWLGTLSGQFWLRADFLVLNVFAGPAQVGEYSLATSLAEKVWLLDGSVSQATLSRVIGSSPADAARLVAKTSRNVLFLAGGGCLLLALLAPVLIPGLFGEDFRPAVIPLWLLLPGILFIAVARPMSSYFSGQLGKPQITSAVSIVTAVVGVISYFALVPSFGAAGAALGSSIAYAVPIVAYVPLFKRSAAVGARELLVVNREDFETYQRLVSNALERVGIGRAAPID